MDALQDNSIMSNAASDAPTAPVTATTTTYVMSPGQAITGLYDYSTNVGVKQWAEATKMLDDKPYDGSSRGRTIS